jgi:two-component system sensor histidine kinase RpfC
VALTADATPEASERCIEAGMDAVLQKPIETAELFRVLDQAATGSEQPVALPPEDETVTDIAAHPKFRSEVRAPVDSGTMGELETLGGRAFVVELAEKFVEEGDRIMGELRDSVGQDDVVYFRDRLHALRSGAANIGARGLYEACLALRAMSAADFRADGSTRVEEIHAEFRRVERYLLDYCSSKADPASRPSASIARLPVKAPA